MYFCCQRVDWCLNSVIKVSCPSHRMQGKCWHYTVPKEKACSKWVFTWVTGQNWFFDNEIVEKHNQGPFELRPGQKPYTHTHVQAGWSRFSTSMLFTSLAFPTGCEGHWPFLLIKALTMIQVVGLAGWLAQERLCKGLLKDANTEKL